MRLPGATLLELLRASPRLMLLNLGLATLSGLLGPAFMLTTGNLVQSVRDAGDFIPPLLELGAVFTLMRVIDPIRGEIGQIMWARVDQAVAARIMRAVTTPPGLEQIESPSVQNRIAQARGIFWGFTPGQAAMNVGDLWLQRVSAVAALAIVARLYWWAALALLIIYLGAMLVSNRHYAEVTKVMWGRTDELRRAFYIRALGLSSTFAKETRIFDLADWLVEQYRGRSLQVLTDVWRKRSEAWLRSTLMWLAIAALEAFVLRIVVTDAIDDRISLGTAVAVSQAVLLAGTLSRYEDADVGITEAMRSIGRVQELEAATRTVHQTRGTRAAEGLPRHTLRFEDVSFTYPSRAEPVLDHFNLDIDVGRSLAIVGENGAGKTTIVKLLTRLYEPTSGRITVDGIDLRELDAGGWHRRVSALFQDYARFEMPAYDNVAFGALHAYSDAAGVERAAELVGVKQVIERLNEGWQTTLSRQYRAGGDMSGGEWQRLAMARALFGVSSGAGILILDEPTASLDVRGEAEIYQQFLEITRGVTTIVISHRFSTVRRADRIIVVEHGRVIEDGGHDELVARPSGRYAEMYSLQASRFGQDA
jgi:ATP-binding cassette subfamily B protein